jgi:transposase InsO family protein
MSASHLTDELGVLAIERGSHRAPRLDNGPELISKALRSWAWEVDLVFSPPGRSWRNGLIESFNGRLRDECVSVARPYSLSHSKGEGAAFGRFQQANDLAEALPPDHQNHDIAVFSKRETGHLNRPMSWTLEMGESGCPLSAIRPENLETDFAGMLSFLNSASNLRTLTEIPMSRWTPFP